MSNNKDKILIVLISVFVALVSWFYVVTEMNPETESNLSGVTIALKNEVALNRSGLVVSNVNTENINVRIKGLRSEVINIENTDINASIDVVGYSEGSSKVPVEINVPENVKLVDYSPKQILVDFEAVINKSVDLIVDINGSEASGYYAMNPESSVNSAIVKGPRSVLNSIDTASVYVDMTGASETLIKKAPINIYDDKGIELNLEVKPNIAEITIPIYPIKEAEIDIPITGQVEEGYQIKEIKIEPKTVLIAGKEEILAEVEKVRCDPISVEGATENVYLPATFIDGNYFIIENVSPRIEVEIEEIITKDLEFTVEDIDLTNMPDNLTLDEFDIPEDFINIKLEGLSSIINEITKEDIKIKGDLSQVVEGENLIELEIETEYELNSYEITPAETIVTLIINEEPPEDNNTQEEPENNSPQGPSLE